MNIKDIINKRFIKLYHNSKNILEEILIIIEPDIERIVDNFYSEFLKINETSIILENTIVEKGLKGSLANWLKMILKPFPNQDINNVMAYQNRIGFLHANLNINLKYIIFGINIIKNEILKILIGKIADKEKFKQAFISMMDLFDLLSSIISDSYFENEMVHESNELSLKFKGLSKNSVIEIERYRAFLLDWLKNILFHFFQTPTHNTKSITKLQYSNFGLWAAYKAEFFFPNQSYAGELQKMIEEIDNILNLVVNSYETNNQDIFLDTINKLDKKVTKTYWYLSSIVDETLEMDIGRDTLTRLFNRRYLNTILRRYTEISFKQNLGFSLLMIDIDYFKKINDQYGHDIGDAILQNFSKILTSSVRASDFVFRYGGEEFLIVLSNVNTDEANYIAEKIRRNCEDNRFHIKEETILLTCSIGISTFDGHPDYNRLIKRADIALYKAKEQGRNRIVVEN